MSSSKRTSTLTNGIRNKRSKRDSEAEDQGYDSLTSSTICTNEIEKESEVGIIEKISLTNFMCHSKLNFTFGSNVNFVIGRNGSGKSAVLTGLVVGLGERATVTSRATNLKGFIKTGQNYSCVEVHLRNMGADAYKPNEYGSTICIERKILRDGASSYKIKSESGKVISNKKEELSGILDQFNIQVDNPVSVLNQNTSRDFIRSKNPKEMYMFFLKATQLFHIKKSNAEATEKLNVAKDLLLLKQETLPQLKHEVDSWAHRARLISGMEDLREKVLNLKRELGWAILISDEETAKKLFQKYQSENRVAELLKEEVSNLKSVVKKKATERTELNKEFKSNLAEIEQYRKEQNESKRDLLGLKEHLRTKESQIKKANSDISSLKNDEKELQKQIDELLRAEPADNNAEKALRDNQIAEMANKKRQLEEIQKAKENHVRNLRDSVSHYSEEYQQYTQERRNVESEITSMKRCIQDLEGSRKNKFQSFGRDVPVLIEKIERAYKSGQFKKKPIGPIGACISLPEHNRQWAVAIEKCLGPLLSSFCCDNFDDQKVLAQLINTTIRDGPKPSIVVSKFQPKMYDVVQHEVHSPPHTNVLRALKIDSPVVANCLIDQRNVESILLIENKEEARHTMTRNVPKKCLQTFTLEGDQVFPVPSFRYYANNNRVSRFLKGSVDDKINEAQETLAKRQSDLQNIKKSEAEAQSNLSENDREFRLTDRELAKVSQEIAKLNIDINRLMNFVEPEPVDVSSLQEEIKLYQEKRLQIDEIVKKCQLEVEEGRSKFKNLSSKYKEYQTMIESVLNQSQQVKDQLEDTTETLSNANSEMQALERKLRQELEDIEILKREWEEAQANVESKSRMLEVYGERVETERSCKAIKKEIMEIERSLAEQEQRQGNEEEVNRRYQAVKSQYERIKSDISECIQIVHKLEKGVQERQARFINFRKDIAIRVKLLFQTCLKMRQYKGSVKFDHENGTLNLTVQPDPNVTEHCNTTRSLSGGERSFSCVCFILALWDAMESPFRILDEYDVFMDMINRRISMDLMLSVAKTKRHNQFIFLTPLEMTKVPASGLVKICRMPDPERGYQNEEDNP